MVWSNIDEDKQLKELSQKRSRRRPRGLRLMPRDTYLYRDGLHAFSPDITVETKSASTDSENIT
jgi:hypothetical protein